MNWSPSITISRYFRSYYDQLASMTKAEEPVKSAQKVFQMLSSGVTMFSKGDMKILTERTKKLTDFLRMYSGVYYQVDILTPKLEAHYMVGFCAKKGLVFYLKGGQKLPKIYKINDLEDNEPQENKLKKYADLVAA